MMLGKKWKDREVMVGCGGGNVRWWYSDWWWMVGVWSDCVVGVGGVGVWVGDGDVW